jgi:hypothetical protein
LPISPTMHGGGHTMRILRFAFLLLSLAGFMLGSASQSAEPETQEREITANTMGTDGGYFYSFWINGG